MSHRVLGVKAGTPAIMRNLVKSGARSVPKWLKQCSALESDVKLPSHEGRFGTDPGYTQELSAQKPIVVLGDRSRRLFVETFGAAGSSTNPVKLVGDTRHHRMNTFAHIVSQRETFVSEYKVGDDADFIWEPADGGDAVTGMPAEEVMTIAQASVEELRKLCVEREMLPVLSDADPEKAVATMRFNLIAQVAVKDFASEYNLRIGEQSMQISSEGPLDAFFAIIGASKDDSMLDDDDDDDATWGEDEDDVAYTSDGAQFDEAGDHADGADAGADDVRAGNPPPAAN